ncbi:hypothetical protein PIB30_002515 [Stylosanthes scabra]|uniref:Uncharacterized protein n=1 Tax=Stylosanthes scabra TaxID=79078 RepID=A0ABU6Y1H7_9FABA|nr:hypothetical protein [Stylosanthes scabra]
MREQWRHLLEEAARGCFCCVSLIVVKPPPLLAAVFHGTASVDLAQRRERSQQRRFLVRWKEEATSVHCGATVKAQRRPCPWISMGDWVSGTFSNSEFAASVGEDAVPSS